MQMGWLACCWAWNCSFIHSVFGDDGFQGMGHSLELLLVCVIKVIHALHECLVHHVFAAGILGDCFIIRKKNFALERSVALGALEVLERTVVGLLSLECIQCIRRNP